MNQPSEDFRPLPNVGRGSSLGAKLRFFLRRFADLQIHTVVRSITPWLATASGQVLEVGCGGQSYRELLPDDCHYQGLEHEDARANFDYEQRDVTYYPGGAFPFPDGSFDCVFYTEVLEHVFEKEQFLQECRRVLKPGGKMIFTVPFQARYHYIPFDYWRFTQASIEKLLLGSGFGDIEVEARGTDVTVACYKCVSLVYRWLLSDNVLLKLWGLLWSPLVVFVLLLAHASLELALGSEFDALGYTVRSRQADHSPPSPDRTAERCG